MLDGLVLKKTLVLSSWYFPHRIVSWESAVTLVFLEKAQVVVEYDEEVRSPSVSIRMPAVIRLNRPVKLTKTSPKLTRGNLYLRDGYCCVYCEERLPVRELTYDHVIPRALQEMMSSRADAHVSRVRAGHLTPITRPADVTKVILSAVDATT